MNRLFFFLTLISTSTALYAQSVTATTDKKLILIGEQLKLQLKGSFPQSLPASWVAVDTIPHFEIMERSKVDTQRTNNLLILTQTFTLTSWDSGRWVIPPITFGAGSTAAIPIKVNWALPFDPKKPYHDIKDIRDVKVKEPSNWYWYFLLIIILIALFLLFFSEKEKKDEKPVLDANAYQKALQQLDALEDENIAAKDAKEYFTRVLNIFRWYLQSGKGIQSYSRTTDDLSIRLQQLNLPQHQYLELVQTLRLADMVKFAKFRPGAGESKNALHTIRDSIITIEKKGNAV